ncbi:hypothetical protein VQL36_19500 [Chengkuizengella sp. SCS-71B]|uniref:hypothetical protein n=1 Tax=Chengkuizengella sp. SCS-71B TaxID=3115290 RepID=UPI0032C22E7C
MDNMKRHTVRLNVKELMRAMTEFGIESDVELAAKLGISKTQVWRAKLPINDDRHNSPGPIFIAGVLKAFGGPFERFFVTDELKNTKVEEKKVSVS